MASIPIIEAEISKNKEAVKLLVEKGSDINQVGLDGFSALSYAKANNKEIYNLLNLHDKLKSNTPITEKFIGQFEVDTEGEYTNNEIDIQLIILLLLKQN